VLLALLVACPAGMSICNRLTFGSYRLTSGFGWHLWNRVLHCDQSIPRQSAELARLIQEVRVKGDRGLALGCWWDLCAQLSRHGYTKEQAERVCTTIAMDGLRQNLWKYIANTFVLSWQTLFTDMPVRHVYPTYDVFFLYLDLFGREGQHVPLVTELSRQKETFGRDCLGGFPLREYGAWARAFDGVQQTGFLKVLGWGYLLWAVVTVVGLVRKRSRDFVPALALVMIVALVIVGSCMLENQDYRYRIPVTPLMIVGCLAVVESACSWLWRRRAARPRSAEQKRPAAKGRKRRHPRPL